MGIDQFKNVLCEVTGVSATIVPQNRFSYESFDAVVVDAMTGLYENPAPVRPYALVRRELDKIRQAVESGAASIDSESNLAGVPRFTFVYMTDIPEWVPPEKREIQMERRKALVPYPADSVLENDWVYSESAANGGGEPRVVLEPVRFFQTPGMTRLFAELVYKTFVSEVEAGHWDGFLATVVMDIGTREGPHVVDLSSRTVRQYEQLIFPSGEAEVRAVWWVALLAREKAAGQVAPPELDHSVTKAIGANILTWSTDQDMLACTMVRMMRNPAHYASTRVHWRFRDLKKETYTLDVHNLVARLVRSGVTPMMLVAFAASCGTDYTKKEHYSLNVSQSTTFSILHSVSKGMTELEDEHFGSYAEALLTKYHEECERRPRHKNRHPVRFREMDAKTRKGVMGRLVFLWSYWINLRV